MIFSIHADCFSDTIIVVGKSRLTIICDIVIIIDKELK